MDVHILTGCTFFHIWCNKKTYVRYKPTFLLSRLYQ